jgi:murein DD-endopeptidase MepM/ murein hydrolase activator NlpD
MALACTWGAYADTDLAIGSFFASDHTVVFRFLPLFPHAYEGPMLASSETDTWMIAQGDFNFDPGGRTKIFVSTPGALVVLLVPIRRNEWHHVALVKKGATALIPYLDGTPLATLYVPPAPAPAGNIRFAKKTFAVAGRGGGVAQFYGLIDDVAIFTRALTSEQVAQLVNMRIQGTEADLLAGYTFPPEAAAASLPALLRRSVTLRGGARLVEPSASRLGVDDARLVPFAPSVGMQLPIDVGDEWLVAQGYDHPEPGRTHRGYASFAWDLVREDNDTTLAGVVTTAAAGIAVRLNEGNDPPSPENFVSVKQADLEFADYLHLAKDSVTVSQSQTVTAGQDLCRPGDMTGVNPTVHLHFAVTNLGANAPDANTGSVTIPVAFSDYEVSSDGRQTWRYVRQGMPASGEWVRRAVAAPNPRIRLSTPSIGFGVVPVGDVRTSILRIGNPGQVDLSVSFPASSQGPFLWGALNTVLRPGDETIVELEFAPTSGGPRHGELRVQSNDPGSPHSIELSGTGSAEVEPL